MHRRIVYESPKTFFQQSPHNKIDVSLIHVKLSRGSTHHPHLSLSFRLISVTICSPLTFLGLNDRRNIIVTQQDESTGCGINNPHFQVSKMIHCVYVNRWSLKRQLLIFFIFFKKFLLSKKSFFSYLDMIVAYLFRNKHFL